MGKWRDKVVLVTGGSAGLGRAIAAAFAASGAKVVIAARRAEALAAAAARLRDEGNAVLAVTADVTRQEDVDRLIARTVAERGGLDVLVNAAGRSMRGAVIDTTADQFRDLIELNLLGVVRCTRAAVPHLLQRRGSVVNIGSLAGKSAARYLGAYPASKFALTAYTQQLRLELARQGLHVLLVCPGPIARDEKRDYAEVPGLGAADRAARPGGGVRTRAIQPEWLARRIVAACEHRRGELIVPRTARLLFAAMQLSPRLGDWLVRMTT